MPNPVDTSAAADPPIPPVVKRALTAEQRAIVDQINQSVSEIRAEAQTRADQVGNELTALRELLARQDATDAVDRIIAAENQLRILADHVNLLPVAGDGAIQDRLTALEVARQRADKSLPTVDSFTATQRAQARNFYGGIMSENPVINDLIDNDPTLDAPYYRMVHDYILGGPAALDHSDRKRLAGTAHSYLRQGWEQPRAVAAHGLTAVKNLLSTDFSPGLGLLVPAPTIQAIYEYVWADSPMLADTRKVSTTSPQWPFLRMLKQPVLTAQTAERTRADFDPEFARLREMVEKGAIDVHTGTFLGAISLEQIEDGGTDIMALYSQMTALDLERKVAYLIHFGQGVGEPSGVQVDAKVKAINSGTADSVPFDAIVNASVELPVRFLRSAAFYVSQGGLRAAIFAKDANERYLWSASNQDGTPSRLYGFPWKREDYLALNTGFTTTGVTFDLGAVPIIFGSPSMACVHVMRLGPTVIRDEYTEPGFVKTTTRIRWGFGVVEPEALVKIVVGV